MVNQESEQLCVGAKQDTKARKMTEEKVVARGLNEELSRIGQPVGLPVRVEVGRQPLHPSGTGPQAK